jgi:ABC-2 type transport system permease protein
MAVHNHVFRPYSGARTPAWARPLVLTRYALRDAFSLKRTIALLVFSAIPALVAATIIYLHHNIEAIKMFEIPIDRLVKIDGMFFFVFLIWQTVLAFMLCVVSGPRMLVADLRDNALPLYLSRPISRTQYLLGKGLALAILASFVTWIPLVGLTILQTSLAGFPWLRAHWNIPLGLFAGSWAAILPFTLLCLAVASVVRRKAAAEAAVIAGLAVPWLVGTVINNTLRVQWGNHLSLPTLLDAIWSPLLRVNPPEGIGPWAAAVTILVILGVAVFVLERRVRAWEVVR